MRLEARLSYALIGLVQATGYAGGLDFIWPPCLCLPITPKNENAIYAKTAFKVSRFMV